MATNNADWIKPFVDLTRPKRALGPYYQPVTSDTFLTLRTNKNLSWFRPLEEPVRTRPLLLTGRQQFLAYVEAKTQNAPHNDFAEQSAYSKFSYLWSEPVRQKAGLRQNLNQFLAMPIIFAPRPTNSGYVVA